MCLENLMDAKALAKFKRSLPKEFPVYKNVCRDGSPQFATAKCEVSLVEPGVYKAGNHRGERTPLRGKYKPGYHAFLSRTHAYRYSSKPTKRFFAKRAWLTAVGNPCSFDQSKRKHLCIVLSHIEVRGRKKKSNSDKQ